MKISLFFKHYKGKACISFVILLSIIVTPSYASASFFSNLFGLGAQAAEVAPATDDTAVIHNSQNIPLPESSINPDLKNIKDTPPMTIVSNEALLSNTSPLGTDSDLEKYASSEKINVYIVKKGDNLDSIAKKLKVPKSTIIASNADLKKSDALKVGQSLVIFAIKAPTKDSSTDDKAIAKKKDEVKEVKKIAVQPEESNIPTPQVETPPQPQVPVVTVPVVEAPIEQPQPVQPETPVSNGQPTGTIDGGYIWPFPKGIGRVSQGPHADNAYDFAAPKGTPIYAVQSGTVLIADGSGYNGGYGLYVVINFDDGRQAIFGHMSQVVATAGQVVKQGDIIGFVGSTGKSTGAHCHIGFHGPLGNPYKGLKVNSTDIIDND